MTAAPPAPSRTAGTRAARPDRFRDPIASAYDAVVVGAGMGGLVTAARKEEVTQRVLAQAERVIPGLARHIVYREAATPLTYTRFTGSTGRTSYGIAATPAQFLERRPGAGTPVGGLYPAGASTRSGHGIIGAMTSGMVAADTVLGTRRAGA